MLERETVTRHYPLLTPLPQVAAHVRAETVVTDPGRTRNLPPPEWGLPPEPKPFGPCVRVGCAVLSVLLLPCALVDYVLTQRERRGGR